MIETSVIRVSTIETSRCKNKAAEKQTLKLWNEDKPHPFIICLLAIQEKRNSSCAMHKLNILF